MSYQPTKPAATDYLAESQADIQGNYAVANNYFGVNHVNFDASLPAGAALANAGKHYTVHVINQAAAPVTAANEVALHSLAGVLYMRKESNGTDIQISGPDPVAGNIGQTFLPGGMILKWGRATVNTTGTAITFAAAFPTACFMAQVTPVSTTKRGSAVSTPSTTGFTAYSENNGTVMFWLAIGN